MRSLLIVDPLPAFRHGLALELQDLGLVLESTDDAVEWATGGTDRVLIVTLGEAEGDALFAMLTNEPSQARLICLMESLDVESFRMALASGAVAALPRTAPVHEIHDAIVRALERDEMILPVPIAHALAIHANDPTLPDRDERAWLQALEDGATVADVARRFSYSERQLYRRLHTLWDRMGVTTREEALQVAVRRQLIHPRANRA